VIAVGDLECSGPVCGSRGEMTARASPSLPASKQKYAAEPLLARVQGSVEGMS
jgi:hypothetical protein